MIFYFTLDASGLSSAPKYASLRWFHRASNIYAFTYFDADTSAFAYPQWSTFISAVGLVDNWYHWQYTRYDISEITESDAITPFLKDMLIAIGTPILPILSVYFDFIEADDTARAYWLSADCWWWILRRYTLYWRGLISGRHYFNISFRSHHAILCRHRFLAARILSAALRARRANVSPLIINTHAARQLAFVIKFWWSYSWSFLLILMRCFINAHAGSISFTQSSPHICVYGCFGRHHFPARREAAESCYFSLRLLFMPLYATLPFIAFGLLRDIILVGHANAASRFRFAKLAALSRFILRYDLTISRIIEWFL